LANDGIALEELFAGSEAVVTYRHRAWHAWAWMIVGPLIVLGLAAGLINRRPIAIQPGEPEMNVKQGTTTVDDVSHSENAP
jgi:cytochrome c oxidase assembly factor CtaG